MVGTPGAGVGRIKRIKGGKYMVTKDLILGGGHTMQYSDDISEKCTLETYIVLVTNVNSINLI